MAKAEGSTSARADQSLDLAALAKFSQWMSLTFDEIRDDVFPGSLLSAINEVVPFRLALLIVYRPNKRPELVHDTFAPGAAKEAIKRFLDATYVLNPVYNAFVAGLEGGVYRITDLAPDAYLSSELYQSLRIRQGDDEELGYRTPGWPKGMSEATIAIELAEGAVMEMSLSRLASDGYSDADLQALRAIEPIVASVARMYIDKRGQTAVSNEASSLDELLHDFGKGLLSAREREVAQLILRGHSGESIALNLEISQATVKTHRQNLYSKLGVTTQQELFSHFLRSLPL